MKRFAQLLMFVLCGAAPSTQPATAPSVSAENTLAALKEQFGCAGYRYEIDAEQRLIFAVAGDETTVEHLRVSLKEQATALQADLFEHKPEAFVTVVIPTVPDYRRLVRQKNVPGAYLDSSRMLIARERGYVVAHEFTHALHAADRESLGQKHAVWIIEGLGAMSEAADFSDGHLVLRDNPRFAELRYAAARKALIPLERLITMDQQEFVKRPNLTYGQAGYVMLYLFEKKQLREFYEACKETYDQDKTGRAALEKVTGMKLPDFHNEWREWLAARKAPTTRGILR